MSEGRMAEDVLKCEIDRGVALVTLNRPDRLNAISPDLGQAYDACMADLALDRTVRVIVLTGAGRAFCGGADTGTLNRLAAQEPGFGLPSLSSTALSKLTEAPEHLRRRYFAAAAVPQPVIAVVNGACVGAGLSLAVSCDVRFASAEAYFCAIFGRRGLIAEHGLAWTLPRLVGKAAATDMLLSGRRIDAATALRIGLATEVLAPEALLDHALAYARDVAETVSPAAARVIKRQLREAESQTLAEASEASTKATQHALTQPDFQEAVAALREKRPIRFGAD
jgi:enoyl-CoA hydratase/carnithine racemase